LLILSGAAEGAEPRIRQRDKRLPAISILEPETSYGLSREEIDWKSRRIEQTLYDFGVPAKVTEVRRGPAVTQFGVEPGYVERPGTDGEIKPHKVRVGQIAALQKDLTLALAAPRLRIEAPVPGRSVVGIEVPNEVTSLVRLRPIVESQLFYRLNAPLAVGLGRDVSGTPVAIDLAKLPHLLVAGTTGSGKSVCINAFVTCLVLNNTPDRLRLVMIDPKKVEFIRFNHLPHLIGKVETEADRAVGVLRWLTAEMDRRYELFAQARARNLGGYNRKAGRGKQLPFIVVLIDELADLMHTYPGDVERTLCRLAQMARATGIHLTVATQRPSTDVITGLIKANFPARLSFAVASGTDSRVILDSVGAEHLLGKGDMLFLATDASGPVRIQGVFVTDTEIEAVTRHWTQSMPDHTPEPAPWESLIAKYALLDETDSLLEAAVELAKKHDNISTSFLQRRLRLGYPRAARLMQHLYEMGLVDDPQAGGRTRRTLVDDDDDPIDRFLSDRK
jgi:S-DNA-T family DNA segregation ATPase FtsK/SpoIIIE